MSNQTITRRQFSAGLLAAGAVALTGRKAKAQAVASGPHPRICVIGSRYRGWQLAAGFHRSGRFDVPVICDCDSACYDFAMQQIKDIIPTPPKHVQDFRKVLDDKSIDAVAIATPDHWHALMAVMALEAGKHVYLEKPASFNIDDGKMIVAAAKRHPKQVIMVGTQQRSGQHFKDAKAFIDSGGLGKIGFARAWMTAPRGFIKKVPDTAPPTTMDYELWVGPAPFHPYNSEKVHYNWHFIRDYGSGDAGNWGGHWLDTVRWLANLDLPKSVMGLGGQYIVQDAKEWPDTQTVIYEYPGLTVLWELRQWSTYGINNRGIGSEIRGEKGTIVIDRDGWTFTPNGDPKLVTPETHGTSQMEEPHLLNFAECIAGTAKPAASIVDGHKSAILCHLANIATTFGRKIEFDPATEMIKDPEAAKMSGREYRKPWEAIRRSML